MELLGFLQKPADVPAPSLPAVSTAPRACALLVALPASHRELTAISVSAEPLSDARWVPHHCGTGTLGGGDPTTERAVC